MNDTTSTAFKAAQTAARQAEFDAFMGQFSSPELFGQELFNLHSLDSSAEATRLLADCIEANWIVFGGGVAQSASLDSIRQSIVAASAAASDVAVSASSSKKDKKSKKQQQVAEN